jgi:tetratricopeptide (TPR) repeat protein
MDIDWTDYQIEQYSSDARRVLQRLATAEPDEALLLRALALLRTYLEIPRLEGVTYVGDEVMVQLANTLYQQIQVRGHWETILLLWPRLCFIASCLPNPIASADLIEALAIVKSNQGKTEEALNLYKQLVATSAFEMLTAERQGSILHQMGVCYAVLPNYIKAKKVLNRCLALEDTPRIFCYKGCAWNILGNLALFHGDFAEAQRCYEESLAALKASENADYMVCVAYQSLGRLLIIQGKPAKAIPLLERGLILRRRAKEIAGAAHAAAYLALAYIQADWQLAEAERLLNEALRICRALNNHEGLALCHLCFGHLESRRENADAVMEQWQQALEIMGNHPFPGLELWVLAPLLACLVRSGRYRESVQTGVRVIQNLHRQRLGLVEMWRLTYYYLGFRRSIDIHPKYGG